ncbi:MAG: hypothetical protein ACT4PE_05470 [Candidatus Eiseniibacteriota bacterium]
MTTIDQLCQLHERLVLDSLEPFVNVDRWPIDLSPAGIAWLADHKVYLATWRQLERAGSDPERILRERFGFVSKDDMFDEGDPRTASARAQTARVRKALEADPTIRTGPPPKRRFAWQTKAVR